MDSLLAPFSHDFSLRALAAMAMLSTLSGLLGVFMFKRRIGLMADALAHAVLPGIGLSFYLYGLSSLALLLGGLGFGLVFILLASFLTHQNILKEDGAVAVFFPMTLALGVFLISLKGTTVDLMHILFGDILGISQEMLFLLAIFMSFALFLFFGLYRLLVLSTLDDSHGHLLVRSRPFVQALFLFCVVLVVVGGFYVMGTLLIVAFILIPAAIGHLLATRFESMGLISIFAANIAGYFGLVLSFEFDAPAAPLIVLSLAGLFFLALICSKKYGLYNVITSHHKMR